VEGLAVLRVRRQGVYPAILMAENSSGKIGGAFVPGVDQERDRSPQMEPLNGKGSRARTRRGSPVTIKDDRTGYQYPAAMHKCSRGRMYLESNYAPRPGSTLHILFADRERGTGSCACPAMIRWRRLLCGVGSSWLYGLGIKYI
jgi:hypothetical protein